MYMRKMWIILLLVSFILISACGAQTDPVKKITDADGYPTISTSISPTNPSMGETVSLTISAEDDEGLEKLSWESSKYFSNYDKRALFNCNLKKTCSYTWELITVEEGLTKITALVKDSSGKELKVNLEVDVQPAVKRKVTTIVENTTAKVTVENETTVFDNSCSTNSDCDRKEKCKSGVCKKVECTTSSQCSGCKRCSSNSCVSCGSGPYGCYC